MGKMLFLPALIDLLINVGSYFFYIGEGALSASLVARFFFDNVMRFFGIPTEMISDRDPRFTVSFW